MDKVLEFDVTNNGSDEKRHFIINADDFDVSFDGSYLDLHYDDFEFLEVEDGASHTFTPEAVTWSGHMITSQEAFSSCVAAALNGDERYAFSHIAPEIEDLKQDAISPVCSSNGRDVADKYFYDECAYDLVLATDKALYYAFEDDAVMLSAKDGSLISDNYFAEEGFMSSVEDILRGDEKEVYAADFVSDVKRGVAQELDIELEPRETVDTGLVNDVGSDYEVSGEYLQ